MSSSNRGLVLEGGGAMGAYHLGAYKALHQMGYRFNGIAGTSIGALNGAIIAQGDWKKAWDFWYNSSNKMAYGIDEEALEELWKGKVNHETTKYAANIIGEIVKNRGLDVENMKKVFLNIFNEDKLRKSKVELGIVTVKVPEFKAIELFKEEIPNGELFDYLISSANFPIFQTRSKMEGYIDGGFRNNLPINMLPEKGITDLIAIRTFAPGFTRKYNNPDIKVKYIEPSKNLGTIMDFNRDRARRNLTLGYYDAYRQIKGYVGKEFCIKPLAEDFTYIKHMLKTADDKIFAASEVMGYKNINPKRFLFEKLFPQIADYLDLGIDSSYEVLILSFFEEIAQTLNIEKDKIYNPMEFIDVVKIEFFKEHKSFSKYKSLPKILQNNTFLSSFVKNEFFHFIMDIFFK